MTAPYPLPSLRALALHTQRLTAPNGTEPDATPDNIHALVEQLGCVQIDTLHRVQRSHYLTLWSRLGNYDPADFDSLIYSSSDRRLTEGWRHAACVVPFSTFRYQIPHMRRVEKTPAKYTQEWLENPDNVRTLAYVLDRIRAEGPLRAAVFKYDGPKRGPWWDWKPAKYALEIHFSHGTLLIANRAKFQRVYDLAEKVLPYEVNLTEPTPEEADRFFIEQGIQALGVCKPSRAGEYSHMKRGKANGIVQNLIEESVVQVIRGELANGQQADLVVHRDYLSTLARAAAGEIVPVRTTFLNPFDNFFWPKGRDMDLWGFHQRLEAYLPAAKRKWGYYCLPILHKDRLVGRFDPKLDRKAGCLHLEALYLEAGIEPEEELVSDIAVAMRDFMAFHQADELVIASSQPTVFGEKLIRSL